MLVLDHVVSCNSCLGSGVVSNCSGGWQGNDTKQILCRRLDLLSNIGCSCSVMLTLAVHVVMFVAFVAQATFASHTTTSSLVFFNLTLVDLIAAMTSHSPNLTTINKTSVQFASWIVRVTDGDSVQYTFFAKKTGASQTNHKFECRLVGHSETAYVLAVFKGSEKAVALAKEKFKNGSVWILSKIKLDGSDSAYISSPLKISVDLVASNVVSCADLELAKQLAEVSVPSEQ